MKASPSSLRDHASHLEIISKSVRSHGGHGWTYDDEVRMLRDAALRLERYESLLKTAANNAHDSGEPDSFEDAIATALNAPWTYTNQE